ncbi:MAG TPA: chemotaxis protein CheB [Planktothrix sp.]|jgi:two-component system chemotaxis response regulator CheB
MATPQIVVIGTSLGGLNALEILLDGLGSSYPLPIVIVQHRAKSRRELLSAVLRHHTKMKVLEPEDKEAMEGSCVYIAPADYHLLVEPGHFALSLEPPVSYARPSIDVLFESAAGSYGAGVVSIVLTGNNSDGAQGAAYVKAAGGMVIVQDPAESESASMPRATMARVDVDHVLKLEEIAPFLRKLVDGK